MLRVVAVRFPKVPLVAKKFVEVEFVVVEFTPVKFWRVVEPVAKMLASVATPLEERVLNVELPRTPSVVEVEFDAKKFVEVAFVVVALFADKFWRVVEPDTKRKLRAVFPATERLVEVAFVVVPREIVRPVPVADLNVKFWRVVEPKCVASPLKIALVAVKFCNVVEA